MGAILFSATALYAIALRAAPTPRGFWLKAMLFVIFLGLLAAAFATASPLGRLALLVAAFVTGSWRFSNMVLRSQCLIKPKP